MSINAIGISANKNVKLIRKRQEIQIHGWIDAETYDQVLVLGMAKIWKKKIKELVLLFFVI